MGDAPAGLRTLAVAAGLAVIAACVAPPRGAPSDGGHASRATETFEVRVWRAGRAIPPGLSAARVAELEAERGRALAELGDERDGLSRLARALADQTAHDEAWCAAAGAAGALGSYAAAPVLLTALEDPSRPARAVAARAALHELYGRWFERSSDVRPYLATITGGAGTRLLLDALCAEEERSRARLLDSLAADPALAAAWLGDPDPRVRSGAAHVYARACAGADAELALERLVAHLEGEHEPQAFHDALAAALPALERSAPDAEAGARLRAALLEIARSAGEPRTLSAARALARLPWRAAGPRDLGHVLTGVDALGAMLRGLADGDRLRGANDPDPLVGVLAALGELCARADEEGLDGELRAGLARESVLAVLADSQQDPAARAAAAAALGSLARPDDATLLASVLTDPAVGAPVKHALLGALRALFSAAGRGAAAGGPGLAGDTRGAEELLAAVAGACGATDADLRRRALELLAEPALEPQVRALDPGFLVVLLEREDGREATLRLLALVERFGRPEMLHGMLALARFDRLCAEPTLLEPLARALAVLAADSAEDALAAARCLASVRAEETHLARLRHALALVAALDDAEARALAPREHRLIAAWTWRVARAGTPLGDATPQGLAFERRLLELHLPTSERVAPDDAGLLLPAESAHLTALLSADLFLAGAGRVAKTQVETRFENAQALAPPGEARLVVLRDRARFRAAANEGVLALADYRRLVAAGPEAERLLGIQDLRAAVGLLGRLDAGRAPGPATAGEACDFLAAIVAREAWRAEPASVRMQDLREWADAALLAREPRHLRTVDVALADLPLTQAESAAERGPPAAHAPVWLGLTREPGWFQELLDLRARVRLGLRELEAES